MFCTYSLTLSIPLFLFALIDVAQAIEPNSSSNAGFYRDRRELCVDDVLIEFSHTPNADGIYEIEVIHMTMSSDVIHFSTKAFRPELDTVSIIIINSSHSTSSSPFSA